jgi:hypothetical protein
MSVTRPPSPRIALWAGALTAALFAVGFRRLTDVGFRKCTDHVDRDMGDDEGRGRLASKPSDIPPRGWKDIVWRVYENINDHRIMAVAAGVTRSFASLNEQVLLGWCKNRNRPPKSQSSRALRDYRRYLNTKGRRDPMEVKACRLSAVLDRAEHLSDYQGLAILTVLVELEAHKGWVEELAAGAEKYLQCGEPVLHRSMRLHDCRRACKRFGAKSAEFSRSDWLFRSSSQQNL